MLEVHNLSKIAEDGIFFQKKDIAENAFFFFLWRAAGDGDHIPSF